jgi:hypothetical protein
VILVPFPNFPISMMRIDRLLDSFSLMGSVWSILTGSSVCTSRPHTAPNAPHNAAWIPELEVSGAGTAFVNYFGSGDYEKLAPRLFTLLANGVTAIRYFNPLPATHKCVAA